MFSKLPVTRFNEKINTCPSPTKYNPRDPSTKRVTVPSFEAVRSSRFSVDNGLVTRGKAATRSLSIGGSLCNAKRQPSSGALSCSSGKTTVPLTRPCSVGARPTDLHHEPQRGVSHDNLPSKKADRDVVSPAKSSISKIGPPARKLASSIPKLKDIARVAKPTVPPHTYPSPPPPAMPKKVIHRQPRASLISSPQLTPRVQQSSPAQPTPPTPPTAPSQPTQSIQPTQSTQPKQMLSLQQQYEGKVAAYSKEMRLSQKRMKEMACDLQGIHIQANEKGIILIPSEVETELNGPAESETYLRDHRGSGEDILKLNAASEEVVEKVERKLKSLPSEALQLCRDLIDKHDDLLQLVKKVGEEVDGSQMQIDQLTKFEEDVKIRYNSIIETQKKAKENLLKYVSSICHDKDCMQETVQNSANEALEKFSAVNRDLQNQLELLAAENKELTRSKSELTECLEEERKHLAVVTDKKGKFEESLKSLKMRVDRYDNKMNVYEVRIQKLQNFLTACHEDLKSKESVMEKCVRKYQKNVDEATQKYKLENLKLEQRIQEENAAVEQVTQKLMVTEEKLHLAESKRTTEGDSFTLERLTQKLKAAEDKFHSAETKRCQVVAELNDTCNQLAQMEERCRVLEKERKREQCMNEGVPLSKSEIDDRNKERDQLLAEVLAYKAALKSAKEKYNVLKSHMRNDGESGTGSTNANNVKIEELKVELLTKEEQINYLQSELKKYSLAQEKCGDYDYDKVMSMNRSLSDEKASLHSKLSEMNYSYQEAMKQVSVMKETLGQREQALHEMSDLVKIRDGIIAMLKDRDAEMESDVKHIHAKLRDKDDLVDKGLQMIEMMKTDITATNNYSHNTLENSLAWKSNELCDLYSTLEMKQMALMALQCKVEELEKMHSSSETQRIRQEARIKALESALYEKCSLKNGLVPVLVQSGSAR